MEQTQQHHSYRLSYLSTSPGPQLFPGVGPQVLQTQVETLCIQNATKKRRIEDTTQHETQPCIAEVNEIENVMQSTYYWTDDPSAWAPASLSYIICEHSTDSEIQATNITTEHAALVFINSIICHDETVSIDQVKQAATTDAQYQDLINWS